ncbi:MAG: glycosyltransferase family 2 protein [Bacteroidales bacterium]|nr:glycosyltransferase family 2 protein [Bacteroidales bacterium]
MKSPKVTIIIPTHNRADILPRAIKSVQAQTFQDYELIIIDDASTDETDQVMKGIVSDKIRYIKLDKNQGQCVARNRAYQKARGEYIGFLDSDDEWMPEKLEKQLRLFEHSKTEKLAAVYCGFIEVDELTNKTHVINRDNIRGNIYKDLLKGFCPSSTSMFLIKSKVFKEVLGFDEQLVTFVDYDLWLRISKAGYIFDYVDEPLIVKYEHFGPQIAKNLDKRLKGLSQLLTKWCSEMERIDGKGACRRFRKNKIEAVAKSIIENPVEQTRKDIKKSVQLLWQVSSIKLRLYAKGILFLLYGRSFKLKH